MTVDWSHFTPWSSLVGGLVIGLATLLLVLGGILFGVGRGIAGYCPGPGIVAASVGSLAGGMFVVAMLAGMTIHDRLIAKA